MNDTLWIQRSLTLPTHAGGFYAITRDVTRAVPELSRINVGLLNLFLQHTSAALTINENADPDVLTDLRQGLDILAPESGNYAHSLEGTDDMPAHIKSSLLGPSLTVPVANGQLLLGVWQDIYLCEFRRIPHHRTLILTLTGSLAK
ncbi:MAG: secondary thiamine-phosphate synthase enzyme YjbQ [Thermoguttaceae bacterium]|nr:secondary thiamine-phosphate synthase enzyme YjbQ [Thermoguttaceae bacterium]